MAGCGRRESGVGEGRKSLGVLSIRQDDERILLGAGISLIAI